MSWSGLIGRAHPLSLFLSRFLAFRDLVLQGFACIYWRAEKLIHFDGWAKRGSLEQPRLFVKAISVGHVEAGFALGLLKEAGPRRTDLRSLLNRLWSTTCTLGWLVSITVTEVHTFWNNGKLVVHRCRLIWLVNQVIGMYRILASSMHRLGLKHFSDGDNICVYLSSFADY